MNDVIHASAKLFKMKLLKLVINTTRFFKFMAVQTLAKSIKMQNYFYLRMTHLYEENCLFKLNESEGFVYRRGDWFSLDKKEIGFKEV